jgi:hypothetical protein
MDNRYYSAPGPLGIYSFKFIAQLVKDKDLDLTLPMVDNYLFEVGYELGWSMETTVKVIDYLKRKEMLI